MSGPLKSWSSRAACRKAGSRVVLMASLRRNSPLLARTRSPPALAGRQKALQPLMPRSSPAHKRQGGTLAFTSALDNHADALERTPMAQPRVIGYSRGCRGMAASRLRAGCRRRCPRHAVPFARCRQGTASTVTSGSAGAAEAQAVMAARQRRAATTNLAGIRSRLVVVGNEGGGRREVSLYVREYFAEHE